MLLQHVLGSTIQIINFQLRRGLSLNDSEVLQSATILYWYFFPNHNRHALPLLLIAICNIGKQNCKRWYIHPELFLQQVFISTSAFRLKESQWSHFLLDFHLFFSLNFDQNSENVHNLRNCMLSYISYNNDVCKTFKWSQCISNLWWITKPQFSVQLKYYILI